ncbi:MAG: DNA polymerase III subunit delta [Candidatus Kerfeldbacteria bacterium]|nr:DNA polymerase III subunit delta [Candidatus Kerfeldbacteria bacterium]
MIIFLTGPDTYRSRERLHALRDAFVKKYDPSGMNVVTLEGAGLKFEDFQQSAASQGMLSSRRFVMVKRPFEADRKTQDAIAGFIGEKSVPEETIVVFWSGEEKIKKRKGEKTEPSRLEAVLSAIKHRQIFNELEPMKVERWMVSYVKDRGRTIEPAAAEKLASLVGSDLWLATNEMDKLMQGRSKIRLADVNENLSATVEANIFEFVDALSRRQQREAMTLLEDQLASGANELYLLAMIARQIRILLGVADLVSREPNPATIASRMKLHPFVVKKALQQIRSFSQSELIAAHDHVVEIDQKMKSSGGDPRVLLELFVLRLCQR